MTMTTPEDDDRPHILVVNDDPAILDLFEELLSEEGYRVTLDNFSVQVQAMHQRLRERRPDLVLLDIMIGAEGNGWQLVQAMKMDRTVRDIPLIICTAAVSQVAEFGEQLDALGVAVVFKPFDIDHLLSVVGELLVTA
jgi:two-component system phosphate regulon response regulator OmpR